MIEYFNDFEQPQNSVLTAKTSGDANYCVNTPNLAVIEDSTLTLNIDNSTCPSGILLH